MLEFLFGVIVFSILNFARKEQARYLIFCYTKHFLYLRDNFVKNDISAIRDCGRLTDVETTSCFYWHA